MKKWLDGVFEHIVPIFTDFYEQFPESIRKHIGGHFDLSRTNVRSEILKALAKEGFETDFIRDIGDDIDIRPPAHKVDPPSKKNINDIPNESVHDENANVDNSISSFHDVRDDISITSNLSAPDNKSLKTMISDEFAPSVKKLKVSIQNTAKSIIKNLPWKGKKK